MRIALRADRAGNGGAAPFLASALAAAAAAMTAPHPAHETAVAAQAAPQLAQHTPLTAWHRRASPHRSVLVLP